MSLDASLRSSPYCRTFFQLFPRSQHQDLLDCLLVLGIQSAQQYANPQLSAAGDGSSKSVRKPKLSDLQGLVRVNAALTFTQNEFLPQAKQAMEKFKQKIALLEQQLDGVAVGAAPSTASASQTSNKDIHFSTGNPLPEATVRYAEPSTANDQKQVVHVGTEPFKNTAPAPAGANVLESLIQANAQPPKPPRSSIRIVAAKNAGYGKGPNGTYGSYPNWWGHQEFPPQAQSSMQPPQRTSSPYKKSASIATVMHKLSPGKPSPSKPARGRSSTRRKTMPAQKTESPWTFPKRMVDESVQATESMTRQEYERIDAMDLRDTELRKAARRVEHNLDAAYTDNVEFLKRGQYYPQEHVVYTQTIEQPMTPPRARRQGSLVRRELSQAGTQSAPPKQPVPRSVFLSYSPPRATRKSSTAKPPTRFQQHLERQKEQQLPSVWKADTMDAMDEDEKENNNSAEVSVRSIRWEELLKSHGSNLKTTGEDEESELGDFIQIAQEFAHGDFKRCLDLSRLSGSS